MLEAVVSALESVLVSLLESVDSVVSELDPVESVGSSRL